MGAASSQEWARVPTAPFEERTTAGERGIGPPAVRRLTLGGIQAHKAHVAEIAGTDSLPQVFRDRLVVVVLRNKYALPGGRSHLLDVVGVARSHEGRLLDD